MCTGPSFSPERAIQAMPGDEDFPSRFLTIFLGSTVTIWELLDSLDLDGE